MLKVTYVKLAIGSALVPDVLVGLGPPVNIQYSPESIRHGF